MLEVRPRAVDGDGAFGDVWLFGAARRMFKGTYTLGIGVARLVERSSDGRRAGRRADGRRPGFGADG